MKKKIPRKFINEYFIAKNVRITCIFNQRNLFNSLILSSLSSKLECSSKNRHSNVCLKFLCDAT